LNDADFGELRYAQCWEDADVLVAALDIRPGEVCLSIASAGDNALAMLAQGPAHVLAVDFSPAQIACLELRVAAYRTLSHGELLELIGSRPSTRREALYGRARAALSADARRFWDARSAAIARGIGEAGRFERYFRLFRRYVLPLIHRRAAVEALLRHRDPTAREAFYWETWDGRRWRAIFRLFFSRSVLGHLGRDPEVLRHVEGDVAQRLLARARYTLTALDPSENPYLQWILCGRHTTALPYALREENFDAIRANLDRLSWRCTSLEDQLARCDAHSVHRFNLSDIFEYASHDHYLRTLERLLGVAAKGGRLAYWNMLAPRHRPEDLKDQLRSLTEVAQGLFFRDRGFFYCAFVLEKVL
jgi:S-adenosylmethionine-diacylglycerol 3-amino-3-carboxypropyl transferase